MKAVQSPTTPNLEDVVMPLEFDKNLSPVYKKSKSANISFSGRDVVVCESCSTPFKFILLKIPAALLPGDHGKTWDAWAVAGHFDPRIELCYFEAQIMSFSSYMYV